MPERSVSSPADDIRVDAAVLSRLRAEVADLRLQMGEEVRTRRIVLVDDTGVGRLRLDVTSDGYSRITLLDGDGFERIGLTGRPDLGVLTIAGRSLSGEPTRVEVFAHDPRDGDGVQIGVHLVDGGNGVAGFDLFEGRSPAFWPRPPRQGVEDSHHRLA
jgi:hypothetical protein